MFTVPATPLPLETLQVWPMGWLATVTTYDAPEVSLFRKVKVAALTVSVSPLTLARVTDPISPETDPPSVTVSGVEEEEELVDELEEELDDDDGGVGVPLDPPPPQASRPMTVSTIIAQRNRGRNPA